MGWCGVLAVMVPACAFGQLYAVAPGLTLVSVDPDSGLVQEIGSIDAEGLISSMEFVGQRLYAVDRVLPHGASLIEISTLDGSVLSRHPMTLEGQSLRYAEEGLGYDPAAGSLVQAFWRSGAASTSSSNTLGYLGFDGVITGIVGYGGADFDGLATHAQPGLLYWVDREPGARTVTIGTVSVGGGQATLKTFSTNATIDGVNDVSWAPDRGDLLATDSVTGMVHRFDPATAMLLGSVMNSAGDGLNTCAYRVPCPADLAAPYGLLDLSDVLAFISAFGAMDAHADFAAPYGLFDLADVLEFVGAFNAGCP